MNKNILVADDDRAIRKLIVKTLEALGVENATEAADGDEALALFELNEFDLILLDWNMPGKTGLEVLRTIRTKDPEIPVIMVSAEHTKSRVEEAAQAGVTDYVVKPFDREILKERLARYCRKPRIDVNATVYRCHHLMTTDVITIRVEATVGDAVALLLEHEISGLPVVDDQNRLLGIITEFELMQSITRPELKGESVGSVMTTDVMTVEEDTIPLKVVSMMQKHRIRRVPVVRDGKLVGVIARRDILRYVTENEEALRGFLAEIRSAVGK